MDPSDKDNKIALGQWPVKSLILPDAISYFSVNGTGYYITANEGDAPEGILFVPADKSPNGKVMLVSSNEGDGTVKFYQTN